MELLNRARAFVAKLEQQDAQAVTAPVRSQPDELRHWVSRLLFCRTIEDFETVLNGFSDMNCWTLEQRALISAVYTPRALKLLKQDEDNKWKWIEKLSAICWTRRDS
jgi:hypothetical protein